MTSKALQERMARCQCLMDAISECGEEDSMPIATAYREEIRTGFPEPPMTDVDDQADCRADWASFEEMRAYFFACGKQLNKQDLGQRGRRSLESLPDELRQEVADDLPFQCPTDIQVDDDCIFQQSSKRRNTACDRSPMPFTKGNPLTRPLRWLNQCMVLKCYAETTIVNVLGRRCERLFCRPRRP